MKTMKIIGVILSLAIIAGLGFCVVWTVTNFEKVQQAMSGSNIYNRTDIDNAYNSGYNTALENEKEYLKLIEGYKDTITELRDTVAQLNSQVTTLTTSNTNLDSTIQSLQAQRTALQTQVNELTATNSSNTSLIESLNTQINSLSQSIATMTEQASNNAKTISTLSNKITALESTTAHYEELLMQYESADKATVKFMINNKVYNMQVVNKNSKVTVATPDIQNIIFNGWTTDGTNIVDLSEITITGNTTFVASITLQYDVIFKVDNVTYNTQKITTGDCATLPEEPTKSNFIFQGWSIDGTNLIDVTTNAITENTTYKAVWTKLFDVNFMMDGLVYDTQKILDCSYSVAPEEPTKTNFIFQGWSIDGTNLIDIKSYAITQDTTFIALFKYSKAWSTLTSVPFGLSINCVDSKEFDINIAPTVEKLRVTFDFIRFEDNVDSGCPICYYSETPLGRDVTLDASKATSIVLESEQIFEFITYSNHKAKIWFTFDTNKIVFNFTVTGSEFYPIFPLHAYCQKFFQVSMIEQYGTVL